MTRITPAKTSAFSTLRALTATIAELARKHPWRGLPYMQSRLQITLALDNVYVYEMSRFLQVILYRHNLSLAIHLTSFAVILGHVGGIEGSITCLLEVSIRPLSE